MYETFDHTADVGLRIRAGDLPTLFAEAGRALFSLIVGDRSPLSPVESRELNVEGTDRDYLLFDWLNELLYLFESEHLLLCQFEVQLDPAGLRATVHGERWDPAQRSLEHEVKAITYHGLRLEQQDGGWLAEVIVDI